MYIIMSCFFVLLCGILVLRVTAINVTNSGNQQEIIDMKKDIVMLRNLVTGMNTTIYTQQQEMRSMNVTIHAQQQEIAYLIGTAQTQEQKTALMESETKEVVRAMNSTIQAQQQIERSMNTTIQDQQHRITLIESANQAQQQIERSINTTIQDQQHRITVMESTIQILKQDNQTINEEVEFICKNNSAEIEHLIEVDKKRNQSYEAFQIAVQDLVINFNTLRNTSQLQIGSINDNLTSLARQVHYTSLSFLDSQKILKELENAINEKNRTYAFTVSSSSNLVNYDNKKIVYDKVITNKGGAYNSNTGIFTCPSPGTYVFTWSTMSNSATQFCKAYIYHNGNQLLMSHSIEQNGGYYEAASNTILLSLTVGDHVWIQTSYGAYCYGYPHTAFSGWKV